MLDFSNVTLLFVETRAHKITARVIADCISKCNFGEILIYTDKPGLIPVAANVRYIAVPDFPNKKEAGQFYYQFAMHEVRTDFALMLEWDGGIKDVEAWTPEFFNYDYIGAPWKVSPHEENRLDVGNGGFTLMSKRLGEFLFKHANEYPSYTDWDVCRKWRPVLEAHHGFKWPSRALATKFSWELTQQPEKVFGFHATFTWPWMLTREETIIRAKLMTETPYLLSKMGDLIKKAPWLNSNLGPEMWEKIVTQVPVPSSYRRMPTQQDQLRMRAHLARRRAESAMTSRDLKA